MSNRVRVTDLLYERTERGWQQCASSYDKIRLALAEVVGMMERNELRIISNTTFMRQIVLVGT